MFKRRGFIDHLKRFFGFSLFGFLFGICFALAAGFLWLGHINIPARYVQAGGIAGILGGILYFLWKSVLQRQVLSPFERSLLKYSLRGFILGLFLGGIYGKLTGPISYYIPLYAIGNSLIFFTLGILIHGLKFLVQEKVRNQNPKP